MGERHDPTHPYRLAGQRDTGHCRPPFSLAEAEARLAALRAAMAAAGHAALVIYGDREHAANLHWLTGFDPRFEEAVMVVTAGMPCLMAGNECLSYTVVSPLVAAGVVRTGFAPACRCPVSQGEASACGTGWPGGHPSGATVGAVGWKWYGADELPPGADPGLALDIPAFLADPLRDLAGRVENATALFMHPSPRPAGAGGRRRHCAVGVFEPHGRRRAEADGLRLAGGDDRFRRLSRRRGSGACRLAAT
jgi:hypothetical protein